MDLQGRPKGYHAVEGSDASVPFEVDVHAMIACVDAPKLEAELHAEFEGLRINKVNYRKEFSGCPSSGCELPWRTALSTCRHHGR